MAHTPPPSAPVLNSRDEAYYSSMPTGGRPNPHSELSRAQLSKSLSTPAGEGPRPGHRKPPAWGAAARRPTLIRAQSIRDQFAHGAANFFGIAPSTASGTTSGTAASLTDSERMEKQQKWANRRMRHCSRLYGKVREPPALPRPSEDFTDIGQVPPARDPLSGARVGTMGPVYAAEAEDATQNLGRSVSVEQAGLRSPSRPRRLERRDSVAKMAWDGLSTLVTKGSLKPKKTASEMRRQRLQSRSFTPGSIATDDSVFMENDYWGSLETPESQAGPASIPSSSVLAAIQESPGEAEAAAKLAALRLSSVGEERDEILRQESGETDALRRMELPVIGKDEEGDKEIERRDRRERQQRAITKKAFTPGDHVTTPGLAETPLNDDVFFDLTPPAFKIYQVPPTYEQHQLRHGAHGATGFMRMGHAHHHHPGHYPEYQLPAMGHHRHGETRAPLSTAASFGFPSAEAYGRGEESGARRRAGGAEALTEALVGRVRAPDRPEVPVDILGRSISEDQRIRKAQKPRAVKRKAKERLKKKQEPLTMSNVWGRVMSKALSNSDRRRYGEGVVGRFFGRTLKRKSELSKEVREQLDDFDDHRPYFTWWVTTVQILVTLVSLSIYGFGPIGFTKTQRTAMILHTSFTLKQVAYLEQENFWFGPSFADLVHLGAKYSPCMRHDKKIYEKILETRISENKSACCIYNDKTGCFQTAADCPDLIAKHVKWGIDGLRGPSGRVSGSVCGQDPRACVKPVSVSPYEWPDDITQWPICEENRPDEQLEHMNCEITGKPCCIGIQGQCRITTREYCDFVRGYFHEEATLCSQVSCLGEVCGMIPFFRKDSPDQFYRLLISIFLHAGLIHCLLTALVQYFLMRDLEKLIGWSRLSVIYLVSGIGGYLASAIFVPYQAEVGPAGAQFGLLASLFVDAIYSWKMIVKPWKAMLQLGIVTGVLFVLGLLPWVDNWAHAFGFVFGLLLSLALFPYIQFHEDDRTRRIIIVVVSLTLAGGLFAMLVVFFYVRQIWDCPGCVYFNCIPFADHFCDNLGLELDLTPI